MRAPVITEENRMKEIHPVALFRLSVLGPLASRDHLARGELKSIIQDLARRDYAIPGTERCRVGEKTLEDWYYRWRREGIEGLVPKARIDQGLSKLPPAVQQAILAAKEENPLRSLEQIQHLLEASGRVARGVISRSALHRFLKQRGLSRPAGSAGLPEEHRRFVAAQANGIWYGDVMHGPSVRIQGRVRKALRQAQDRRGPECPSMGLAGQGLPPASPRGSQWPDPAGTLSAGSAEDPDAGHQGRQPRRHLPSPGSTQGPQGRHGLL